MATNDQYGARGVRPLTPEEQARIAAQQAQYQVDLAARQAIERQQFDQTQGVGLANQAGRAYVPDAPAVAPVAAPVVAPVVAPAAGLAAASVSPPAAPTTPQYNTNYQVLQADRANLAALVNSVPGAENPTAPATTLPAASLDETNRRTIGPLPGAANGNFNQATTSTVGPNGQITSTLRQPDNIIQGGYGGFGVGGNQSEGARQYLDRMAAQDRADAAVDTAAGRRSIDVMDRIGLSRAATQGTNEDRLQARRDLKALDTRSNAESLLATQEAGLNSRAGLAADTSLAQAGLTGEANIAAAVARANAAQAAANTTGQYGLQAAAIKAAGASRAAEVTANSPQGQLAAQRALLIQNQLGLAGQAQVEGDVSGTYAALGLSRPVVKPAIDPVTGVPYTPEEIAIQQQQRLARLRAQQE